MTTNLIDPLSDFPWSAGAEKAAMLLADGERSHAAVAREVGVHQDTIRYWLKHPDFRERIKSIIDAVRVESLETGVLNKLGRVHAMQDRWQRLRVIIEERAEDLQYQTVAGGKTGLLVHKLKMLGSGDRAIQVDEYEIDTGLLSEMRALEKHIAQELGQFVEKTETDHTVTRIEVVYENMDPRDL